MDVGRVLIFVCAGVMALPITASAGDEPDTLQIVKKADAATKAVRAFSYKAQFHCEGELADAYPRFTGSVEGREGRKSLLRSLIPGGKGKGMYRYRGSFTRPGSDERLDFDIATDGKQVFSIDRKLKQFLHGRLPAARSLLAPGEALTMIEFLHPTPFSDEIRARERRYEGTREIEGVDCDVVYVVYAQRGGQEARWFFSREDSLPRRVERFNIKTKNKGCRVLTLSNLDVKPKFDATTFKPTVPQGFESHECGSLLPVGSIAPDWALKTTAGRTVRLEELRGHVVVLDFWATWCAPCKAAMPSVQKLHRKYRNQPVKIFGVNCWEERKGANPAAVMKQLGCTYTLLLDADRVAEAYRLEGIPTFYVIDGQGRIAYGASGFTKEREGAMVRAINQSVERIGNKRSPTRQRVKVQRER